MFVNISAPGLYYVPLWYFIKETPLFTESSKREGGGGVSGALTVSFSRQQEAKESVNTRAFGPACV